MFRRSQFVTRPRLQLFQFEDRLVPTTFVWTNKNGGFWDEKTNWEPQFVPTADDTALINAISDQTHGGQIIVRDSRGIAAVQNLGFGTATLTTFPGGSLSVSGDSSATFTQVMGTAAVSGKQSASVQLVNGGSFTAVSLTNTVTAASGASTFNGNIDNGTLVVSGGASLNYAGGTFTGTDSSLSAIHIFGTLTGGAVLNTAYSSATPRIEVAGGVASTITHNDTASRVNIDGTVNATTNYTSTIVEIDDANGSITGGGTWNGVTFEIENTALNPADIFNYGGQTLKNTIAGTLKTGSDALTEGQNPIRITNGFFTSTGLTLNFGPNQLAWTGGTVSPGFWTNAGSLTLSAAGTLTNATAFTNTGTLIHNAGTLTNGGGASALLNSEGATYDIRGDLAANWGAFTNKGAIIRSAGSGLATFAGSTFSNVNSIEVRTGTLFTSESGTSTGGTFKASAGAIIDLGKQSYSGAYTGSGAGLIRIASGFSTSGAGPTFNMPPAGLLQWTGGTISPGFWTNAGSLSLNSAGTLTNATAFTNTGTLIHIAGTLVNGGGASALTNADGATYDIRGDVAVNWGAVTNKGAIVRSAGSGLATFAGSTFNNVNLIDVQTGTLFTSESGASTGGTFLAAAGATLDLGKQTYNGTYAGVGAGRVRFASGFTTGSSTAPAFNLTTPGLLQWTGGTIQPGFWTNAGFLTLNGAGMLNSFVVLTNTGTVIHQAGAVAFTGAASITNAPGAIYDFRGDATANWGPFSNKGTIIRSTSSGTATIANTFTNSGGAVDIQSGTLDLPGTLTLSGTLQGSGTLLAPVTNSSGSVKPGSSPGVVTINGGYTQSDSGELRIELNGVNVGTQHDQLNVLGPVSLGGLLAVVPGYEAKVGDQFLILANDGTDKISGTFNTLAEGAKFLAAGIEFQISYVAGTGNDVGLTISALPTLLVNGGAAQRSRLTTVQLSLASPINAATLQAPGAVTFTRTGGGVVDIGSGLIINPASGSASNFTFTFANIASTVVQHGSLADGYWQLNIPSLGFSTALNDPILRRLFGDINGDGTVEGSTDFSQFGNAFGVTMADSPFDFDMNGTIDGSTDFAQFGARFGLTI